MKTTLKIQFLIMGIISLLSNNGCSAYLNWLKENAQEEIVFVKPDQDIEGHKEFKGVVTLSKPVNPTDAVNKAYVDYALSTNESDPIFHASDAFGITIGNINNWNNTEWIEIEEKPTTIKGYGITDALETTVDTSFIESLKIGDMVLTIGGIYGKIQNLFTYYVNIDVGNNVILRVNKYALRRPETD